MLLIRGGIDLVIERAYVFVAAFILGAISRLLVDPDSRTVFIDEKEIRVVRIGKTQQFSADEVDRILVFQRGELVFAIKVVWRTNKRRPLVSGGRLAPGSADIGELSRTYHVVREASSATDSAKQRPTASTSSPTSMKQFERYPLMLPKERKKWSRWRKRGRFRFLLAIWGIISIAVFLALSFLVSVVPEFDLFFFAIYFVMAILFAIPLTLTLGKMTWDRMERRYEASRDCSSSANEQREDEC